MSNNERETEKIVRKKLEKAGISEEKGFLMEEQKSQNPLIVKLLKNASKSGEGIGKPEFIITNQDSDKDFVVVVECKAEEKYHESKYKNLFKDYAVDGALLYASYLAKEFNVIAIGASGQTENSLKISTYLYPKGASNSVVLCDENNHIIDDIISWQRYIERATFDPVLAKTRHSDLMKFSRELHNYMRDYAKVTEAQKPLLVSGILLALMDKGFERAYIEYDGEDLAEKTFQALKDTINKAQLGDNQESKKRAVINAFSFIEHHPELHKIDKKKNESPLLHIIQDLHIHVKPFTKDHYDFDIIGNFYGEFIRYTGGDGKGLGIVLTPKHITDLFADLAKLNKNSVVLDTCCGTGGFLISAMKKMTENVSAEEKKHILGNSLIGIEQEPQMFALAVSNMILRGDGKTNLFQGSCFDENLFEKVKGKASAGFMNPPFSQKGEDLHEWNFIIQMLNALQQNAVGIVIVPMSLAVDTRHPLREQLLKEHRLEAIMSMPDDLFYPVGVVSCIMIFSAHVPHDSDKHHESWFGYWKNDGFKKDRLQGRIPSDKWSSIREKWLSAYVNRKEVPGFSVRKKVGISDEWCAESYLETDYSDLNNKNFIKNTLDFVSFKVRSGDLSFIKEIILKKEKERNLSERKWNWFLYNNLFDIETGIGPLVKPEEVGNGDTPFISTTESDNGISYFYKQQNPAHQKNCITVSNDGSVGEAFYQDADFSASYKVNVLKPKFELNKYIAMFLITILRKEKYRYSYARKWGIERMRNTKIKLPVDALGNPDWKFMEEYIKSLPYSAEI